MVFQLGLVASVRDGMEIEVEDFRFGEEQRRELADPAVQELFLVDALGAVGVIGRERFFRQDVEAGEESERFIVIEVVDVRASFLIEEFEDKQAEEGVGGGNHARAGIAGFADEAVDPEPCEQGKEQEESGDTRAEASGLLPGEQPAVGGRGLVAVGRAGRGSATRDAGEKGGVRCWRISAWNWATRFRSIP